MKINARNSTPKTLSDIRKKLREVTAKAKEAGACGAKRDESKGVCDAKAD